jgi:hypothetical protein
MIDSPHFLRVSPRKLLAVFFAAKKTRILPAFPQLFSMQSKETRTLLRRNHRRLSLILLLLILHQLNIILLNLLILLTNPLLNILTQISLYRNNLTNTTRQLSR